MRFELDRLALEPAPHRLWGLPDPLCRTCDLPVRADGEGGYEHYLPCFDDPENPHQGWCQTPTLRLDHPAAAYPIHHCGREIPGATAAMRWTFLVVDTEANR